MFVPNALRRSPPFSLGLIALALSVFVTQGILAQPAGESTGAMGGSSGTTKANSGATAARPGNIKSAQEQSAILEKTRQKLNAAQQKLARKNVPVSGQEAVELQCDWPGLSVENLERWLRLYQKTIGGDGYFVDMAGDDILALLENSRDPFATMMRSFLQRRTLGARLKRGTFSRCWRFLDMHLLASSIRLDDAREVTSRIYEVGQRLNEVWHVLSDLDSQNEILFMWQHLVERARWFQTRGMVDIDGQRSFENKLRAATSNKELTEEQRSLLKEILTLSQTMLIDESQYPLSFDRVLPESTNFRVSAHSDVRCEKKTLSRQSTVLNKRQLARESMQRFRDNPGAVFKDMRGVLLVDDVESPGFVVLRLADKGFFQSCGFRKGDIITRLNDVDFTSNRAMAQASQAMANTDVMTFNFLRSGKPSSIHIVLKP